MQHKDYLNKVVEFAEENDLATKGPWTLSQSVARDLSDRTSSDPPGGWNAFVGLVAGTEYVSSDQDGFNVEIGEDELKDLDEHDLKRQLVESFTINLVPPSAAAGFFLAADIHPVAGLRVARRVQRNHMRKSPDKEFMGPKKEQVLDSIRSYMGAITDDFLDILKYVEGERSVASISEEYTDKVLERLEKRKDEGLPMKFPDQSGKVLGQDADKIKKNVYTLVSDDLLKSAFVPSGAVKWADKDGTYISVPDKSLLDVNVFHRTGVEDEHGG